MFQISQFQKVVSIGGIDALAFILFGHVSLNWRSLSCASIRPREQLQSHKQMHIPDRTSIVSPAPVYLICPLDKTPVELPQTPLFWFEFTDQYLAQEPQSPPPTDPNKGTGPDPIALSTLCFNLSVWFLQVCCILLSGPMNNKHLYFNFFCGLLWTSD